MDGGALQGRHRLLSPTEILQLLEEVLHVWEEGPVDGVNPHVEAEAHHSGQQHDKPEGWLGEDGDDPVELWEEVHGLPDGAHVGKEGKEDHD